MSIQYKHPNSKKVKIMRMMPFYQAIHKNEPVVQEIYANSFVSIGSYFKGHGSKQIGSGLERPEQKLLLPYLLDIPVEDKDFWKAVNKFYENINIKIGAAGLDLEIGLETSNDEPLSITNEPLNIENYILYRHALHHPQVAKSKEEAEGDRFKLFYIYSKEESTSKTIKINEQRDKAYVLYMEYKNNVEKVEQTLTLMGVQVKSMELSDRVIEFRKKAETEPEKFITIIQDKYLEMKHFILQAISANILERIGNSIILDNEPIGYDMQEAVIYLTDKKNSKTLTLIKARLQEYGN